ncbi:hypothetical protein H0H81_001519, partial [Sphagnurus paluster]
MVKRAKSPDTAEDEKYFTIYQPYPLNANWELPSDYITFSRWIAAIIGTNPIHALHYKPRARGMVIIEVDKKYPHNERLLGEHKWSQILTKPTDEEKDRVSQIFHCLYKTGREAQKDGDGNASTSRPSGSRIGVLPPSELTRSIARLTLGLTVHSFQSPYPDTEWCPTPPEDKTNKPLCRPLPTKDKPPPPKVEVPGTLHATFLKIVFLISTHSVVGSTGWVSAKTAPSQKTPQALKSAWGKGPPVKTNTAKTAGTQSAGAPRATSPLAWGAPKSPKSPVSPGDDAPPFPPGIAINVCPGQSLPAPPGLTKRTTPYANPNSGSGLSSGSGSGSGSSLSSDGDVAKGLNEVFEEKVMISLSPSQNRDLYGLVAEHSPEIGADVFHPWETNIAPSAYEDLEFETTADNGPVDLWGEETGAAKKPEVALCPDHQHLCKKGVCRWRARQVKEEERLAALAKKIDGGGKSMFYLPLGFRLRFVAKLGLCLLQRKAATRREDGDAIRTRLPRRTMMMMGSLRLLGVDEDVVSVLGAVATTHPLWQAVMSVEAGVLEQRRVMR